MKLWKFISECSTVLHWIHSGGIRNHDSCWINCGREEVIILQNSAALVSLEYTVLGLYRIYHIYVFGNICITHLCVLIFLTQGLSLLQIFAPKRSFIPFLSSCNLSPACLCISTSSYNLLLPRCFFSCMSYCNQVLSYISCLPSEVPQFLPKLLRSQKFSLINSYIWRFNYKYLLIVTRKCLKLVH